MITLDYQAGLLRHPEIKFIELHLWTAFKALSGNAQATVLS